MIFTSLILIVFHFDISILKLYSSHILVSLSIKKRESYKKKTEIVAKKKRRERFHILTTRNINLTMNHLAEEKSIKIV